MPHGEESVYLNSGGARMPCAPRRCSLLLPRAVRVSLAVCAVVPLFGRLSFALCARSALFSFVLRSARSRRSLVDCLAICAVVPLFPRLPCGLRDHLAPVSVRPRARAKIMRGRAGLLLLFPAVCAQKMEKAVGPKGPTAFLPVKSYAFSFSQAAAFALERLTSFSDA